MDEIEIYQKGINEGMKHQTPSEETKKMIDEWTKVKWIVMTLLFGIGGWVGALQVNMNNLQASEITHEKDDKAFQKKLQENEVQNAEIRTKLVNIETTLVEIRQALKIKPGV